MAHVANSFRLTALWELTRFFSSLIFQPGSERIYRAVPIDILQFRTQLSAAYQGEYTIFTPKKVVENMVDLLEEENPGIFSDPDKTFADLYMKSGLYITEIVKRLYRNPEMKRKIPNDRRRIQHILENQVYGLAPTKIIYRIATNYIFGFDPAWQGENDHFRLLDAAAYAKEGKLAAYVKAWKP